MDVAILDLRTWERTAPSSPHGMHFEMV